MRHDDSAIDISTATLIICHSRESGNPEPAPDTILGTTWIPGQARNDEEDGTYEPVAQTLRSPFDRLRANGIGIENIGVFPFVLSPSIDSGPGLSKHENGFVQQAHMSLYRGTRRHV